MPKSKAPRKKKAQKKPVNQVSKSSADQLKALHSSCLELLRSATTIAPFLEDDSLVKHGDIVKIKNQTAILNNDLEKYFAELNDIHVSWPATIDETDPDILNDCIRIAGQYEDWQHQFMQVVLPNVSDLSEQLRIAEENKQKVEGMSNE